MVGVGMSPAPCMLTSFQPRSSTKKNTMCGACGVSVRFNNTTSWGCGDHQSTFSLAFAATEAIRHKDASSVPRMLLGAIAGGQ
jgi:hypothetical protein